MVVLTKDEIQYFVHRIADAISRFDGREIALDVVWQEDRTEIVYTASGCDEFGDSESEADYADGALASVAKTVMECIIPWGRPDNYRIRKGIYYKDEMGNKCPRDQDWHTASMIIDGRF